MQDGIVRVAIGGQGRSGYNIHARHLEKDKDRYRIVAVADQIAERRKDARNQFGARTYNDWSTMIKAGGLTFLSMLYHLPCTLLRLKR